jgi:hypothetical protein
MSETDVDSWAETDAEGEQWAEGDSKAESWAESSAISLGKSVSLGHGVVTNPDGDELSITSNEMSGTSAVFMSGTSAGGSRAHASSHGGSRMRASTQGGAHGVTHSVSEGINESESESHTTGTTTGKSLALQRGTSEVETTGTSRAITRGRTPSWSEEESESVSETVSPFHEYHREDIVSSRTYLTPEEQTRLAIQVLKAIPKAHFALKTPESTAHLVQAPWVDEPRITSKKLEATLARVYAEPFYIPRNTVASLRTPELLQPAAEPEPDDEDFFQ